MKKAYISLKKKAWTKSRPSNPSACANQLGGPPCVVGLCERVETHVPKKQAKTLCHACLQISGWSTENYCVAHIDHVWLLFQPFLFFFPFDFVSVSFLFRFFLFLFCRFSIRCMYAFRTCLLLLPISSFFFHRQSSSSSSLFFLGFFSFFFLLDSHIMYILV